MRPLITEGKIDWAIAARKFIALRKQEFLQQAVRMAQDNGERDIAEILLEEGKGNPSEADLGKRREKYGLLIPVLFSQNRAEEALTLGMLDYDLDTTLVTTFRYLSIDDAMRVFHIGMQACKECINLANLLNDSACAAHYLVLMGMGFYSVNDSARAIEYSTQALEKYERLVEVNPHDFAPLTASTLAAVGESKRLSRQFSAAIESLTRAREMFRGLSPSELKVREDELANVINSLGLALDESKQFRPAIKMLSEALTIYRGLAASDPMTYEKDVAMVLNNLGIVQRETRQLEQARASLSEALEIRRRLSKLVPEIFEPLVATTLSNVGNVQRELNRHQEAVESYSEAIRKLRELAKSSPPVYQGLLAQTLNNMGLAYAEWNELEPAVECYNEALEIRRMLAQQQTQVYEPDLAQTLVNIGIAQRKLEQFERAIESLTEALSKYRTLAKLEPQLYDMHVARALHYLGTVHSKTNCFNEALQFYIEALEIRRRLAEAEPHIYDADVVVTLGDLGFLYVSEKNFPKAVELLEEAKAIAERSRDQMHDLVRRNQMFQANADVYRYLMICYVKLCEWTKALEIAEQGKSRSLNDLLNLRVIRPRYSLKKIPTEDELRTVEQLADSYEDILTRIQQIESNLTALYHSHKTFQNRKLPERGRDKYLAEVEQVKSNIRQQIEELNRHQINAVSERNKLLQQIRRYDKGFPPRSQPIDVNQILDVSEKSKRSVLLLRVTEVGTFSFVIFPDKHFEVLITEELTSKRLNQLIQRWFEPYFNDSFNRFREGMKPLLAEVYAELLKPVHDLLKARKCNEVLLVPTGALSVLPLHACCWEENSETRYLIDELTISYAASISVFKNAWENAEQRRRYDRFLFVTNPTQDLNFAVQEVDGIISSLITSHYIDLRNEKADKESVKTEMGNDFAFYHFACHGKYNWRDAFSSPLWMSGKRVSVREKAKLPIEEQFKIEVEESKLNMTLKEIMETNLSTAWLITLSACETGLVDFSDETDEHYGFPLGLLFAGSPSVWSTLWQVDDKATSELMQKAYKYLLKDGKSKSEALRQAQIEYRKEKEGSDYSSPYYWAGFLHYGV